MEFFQFHPTGIVRLGILLSEAARGEGGIPAQRQGRALHGALRARRSRTWRRATWSAARSCRRSAPGRGIGGKDYVYLDLRHLGRKVIEEKLPDITDFARIYLGVEPLTEPVPIQPTAHYAMGGIPTDVDGRVVIDPRQHRSCPASTPPASAPASASTAPTGWAPTRCVDILVFGQPRRAGHGRRRARRRTCRRPPPRRRTSRSPPSSDALRGRHEGENAGPHPRASWQRR